MARNSLDPKQDPDWDFWLDPDSMNMDLKHCGKVARILIKFSHILTIYTQLKEYIGTLLKEKLFTLVFKTAFLVVIGAGSRNRSRSRLDRLHNIAWCKQKEYSKREKHTYLDDLSLGHGNCGSNCNQETDTSFLGWVPLHWNYVASENSKVYSMIQMYRYCRNFVWECVVFGSLWSWQVILVAGFRFFLARPRLIYF